VTSSFAFGPLLGDAATGHRCKIWLHQLVHGAFFTNCDESTIVQHVKNLRRSPSWQQYWYFCCC